MPRTILQIVAVAALVVMPFMKLSPQGSATSMVGAQRTAQFENEEVSVWRTVVPPNQPLAMHTHKHPRVIVALTDGTMKMAYENGSSQTHEWESGKAYWLPTAEGLKVHSDVNTGSKPIEVMVVELKKAD
jgi:quercetin dioxygenase-like cupin family protein